MKPYQFYKIRRFPNVERGKAVKNEIQLTFSGQGESVATTLTLENPEFEGSLGLMRVQSEIKHQTFGFIKTVVNHERRKFDFTEYLEPVDFPAYIDRKREVIIFQAPKKTSKGVLSNLRANPSGVELVEMKVDFGKLLDHCSEFFSAWFRGVSARVHAANLSGDQIQDDALFKKLLKDGDISNVTIPWQLDGAEHRVMITGSGAIVLVQDYQNNQGIELQIVGDVHDRLLTKIWDEKKTRGAPDDSQGDP